MSSDKKLTKKQKKAAAFRQRGKPGKDKNVTLDAGDVEDNEVPVLEVQDVLDTEADTMEVEDVGADKKDKKMVDKGKGKAKEDPSAPSQPPTSKKRKREGEDSEAEKPRKKPTTTENSAQKKERYILFVGNLKFTTTAESIASHFSACDPPPTIRLLTPKPTSSSKPTIKSKGCAFLEFTHKNALQQALKLHHSQLDGRMINVELTAGGGGKGDTRLAKLKQRNKDLHSERTNRLEKANDLDGVAAIARPQRFSSTSGVAPAPIKKRTWTVEDTDDGQIHRGGKKHSKKRGSRSNSSKNWATGVNSIPVG